MSSPNTQQPYDVLSALQDMLTRDAHQRHALEQLVALAQQQIVAIASLATQADMQTVENLGTTPITMDRKGRRYYLIFTPIFVDKCQVNIPGTLPMTLALAPGWNNFVVPDAATLTAPNLSGIQPINVLRTDRYPGPSNMISAGNDGISVQATPIDAIALYNGMTYDRQRELQGKGVTTTTLNGAANAGQNLATLAAGAVPAVGQPIYFQGGTAEVGYVQSVSGQVVTLTANLANTHATGSNVQWDAYAALGPGVNGMLPTGTAGNALEVWDPATALFYLARAASADNAQGVNLPMVGVGISGGGSGLDRWRNVAGSADGQSIGLGAVGEYCYNGNSWDKQRGNQDNISLIVAAGATTTQTTADQTNFNARGVIVVLDMTTVGTGSVTLEIDMKDPISGKYIALLTGAAVITNSTNIYTVYPGAAVAANASASSPLPRTWRVKVTANNANPTTYTVGGALII